MSDPSATVSPEAAEFYRQAMTSLREHEVPFLVGGAYALARYTGITRHTKDMDLFLIRSDLDRAFAALADSASTASLDAEHWLGKVKRGDLSIDLIFATGNGVSQVDQGWFERSVTDDVFDVAAKLCSAEDMLWTKAFVQERERYDGADVAHLILRADLNWDVLMQHFAPHWRVLLAHLVYFGFSYPSERKRIPAAVMQELIKRLENEERNPAPAARICNGTLLSRAQYLPDVHEWGFADGRLEPEIRLTADQVAAWTDAIER